MADAGTSADFPVTFVPHEEQKAAAAGKSVPQLLQTVATACPHVIQNLAPEGTSEPQSEQFTITSTPKYADQTGNPRLVEVLVRRRGNLTPSSNQ